MTEKSNIEVQKQVALTEMMGFKCTIEERSQISGVAKQAGISTSELIRNVLRKNLHQFAISENMIKYLRISGEIDALLVEKEVTSSRKASNFTRMIEVLIDFEALLKTQSKNFDYDGQKSWRLQIDKAMLLIYNKDSYLYEQLEPYWARIIKSKAYKVLDKNI